MADSTHESDAILAGAKRSLADNRAGGYHRRGSIGRGSAERKTRHLMGTLTRVVLAGGGIVAAAMVAGLIVDGIGFVGVLLTFLAIVVAIGVFTAFPKIKVPQRADLNQGNARELVGRTELWLEHQRAALPPPAAKIVDDLGVQLDSLGLQLETVDQAHPAVREVRQLVGEHLPEMIDSYRKVPAHLRQEQRAGASPDQQLTEGLGKISREIDSVTRQLADGALDDLALRHRYLDYRYGEGAGKEDI